MSLRLSFHGAAGCVTGFCARLETDQATVLIDCGMFQGSKTLKALNYQPFPFDAGKVDAVLLTHAHIDHSGLLPKLMLAGFEGPIYATEATRELCEVMLADAGGIQESEVAHLNRRNQQRGRPPVEPIYTEGDGRKVVRQFKRVELNEVVEVAPGVSATYWEAGHILGSTSIEVRVETAEGVQTILFSGDLGSGGRDYSPDPQGPAGVDHLVIESTYGDREREVITPDARRRLLAEELAAAHEAGGPLLIPAFAVERSQELLADLMTLMASGDAPAGDIFLDSPLAIEATEIFVRRGWNKASGRNPFKDIHASGRLKFLRDPWESDSLERLRGWHVIMAASGMCDAGRVRKHLKRLLWRREATVLIAGYQATGTLGRILLDGARNVRIQGEDIHVRARIRNLDIYSAHADATGLTAWAKARGPVRGAVFVAHGEPQGAQGLADRLAAAGFDKAKIHIPRIDQRFRLQPTGPQPLEDLQPRIASPAAARPDWHNARAQLLIDLDTRLEHAGSDEERADLIRRLARDLGR
ncbi:MBL fold metallo-hydrolase [Phenylobacterium montanum]|uniref:MBL fold metallo-hydrolase n=1 Tax=Phenylobacterium montanum TaxID=2823693 RepID=A0A975G0K5_9CAUL|nr:MBL fold metallo-hydrolase [Caulobacter sp. S6]QUD88705.1 MBL fold metallo-hydrolase [Caulobacter sp. S6]